MTAHKPAAQVVRDAAAGRPPRVGIVLGSGLADIAGFIEQSIAIPYDDLPGFPVTTVEGHTGKLVIGDWAGTRVACMQGRFHVYEGHDPVDLALPIRALGECGCDILLLTCAAGSLQENMPPGSLVMLSDHINWSGVSPLAGPNDNSIGPRFVDLNRAYDPELRALLHESARRSVLRFMTASISGVWARISRPRRRSAPFAHWEQISWVCRPCRNVWWHATGVCGSLRYR